MLWWVQKANNHWIAIFFQLTEFVALKDIFLTDLGPKGDWLLHNENS